MVLEGGRKMNGGMKMITIHFWHVWNSLRVNNYIVKRRKRESEWAESLLPDRRTAMTWEGLCSSSLRMAGFAVLLGGWGISQWRMRRTLCFSLISDLNPVFMALEISFMDVLKPLQIVFFFHITVQVRRIPWDYSWSLGWDYSVYTV